MSLVTPDGKTKNDICKSFNKIIQKLSNKAYIMSKRSIDSQSIKNQIKLLLDEDQCAPDIITKAGPGIYKYRTFIENKDVKFWEKVDFETEYGHTEKMKLYGGLLTIIKNKWSELKEEETDEIGGMAQELLELYKIFAVFELIEGGKVSKEVVNFKIQTNKSK